jgi:hypothetical protein
MVTRAEQRNMNDDKDIEYQVFGRFKSQDLSAGADAGDDDHRCLPIIPNHSAHHLSDLDFLTQCIFFAAARVAFPSTANAIDAATAIHRHRRRRPC